MKTALIKQPSAASTHSATSSVSQQKAYNNIGHESHYVCDITNNNFSETVFANRRKRGQSCLQTSNWLITYRYIAPWTPWYYTDITYGVSALRQAPREWGLQTPYTLKYRISRPTSWYYIDVIAVNNIVELGTFSVCILLSKELKNSRAKIVYCLWQFI